MTTATHEAPADQTAGLIRGRDLWQCLRQHAPDALTPAGSVLHEARDAVFQAIDTTAMTATFVILTDEPNRHGNSHQITAGKLGQGLRTDLGYDKNPIVLYSHGFGGMGLPVALSASPEGKLSVKKSAKLAVATAFFPERLRDVWPQGIADADEFLRNVAAVFSAIDAGMLRMSSIGFNPILAMLREQAADEALPKGVEKMRQWRGLHFTETEMLEWSITPIGVDRGALRQAVEARNINGTAMPEWMVQSFAQAAEPRQAWSPGMAFDEESLVERIAQRVERGAFTRLSAALDRIEQASKVAAAPAPAPSETPRLSLDGAHPPATITPTIGPEQLAQAFRQQGQADVAQQIAAALIPQVGTLIAESIAPVAKDVQELTADVRRRTGRLPG